MIELPNELVYFVKLCGKGPDGKQFWRLESDQTVFILVQNLCRAKSINGWWEIYRPGEATPFFKCKTTDDFGQVVETLKDYL